MIIDKFQVCRFIFPGTGNDQSWKILLFYSWYICLQIRNSTYSQLAVVIQFSVDDFASFPICDLAPVLF